MSEIQPTRVKGDLHLATHRGRLSERALIVLNLSLFIGSGTLICFWVWYYTDWIEEFGAVLTLGGALSWLAVLLRLIPEDRIKTVQEAFFSAAFEKHGALPWQGLAMAAVAAVLFCFATVQIESVRESVERAVVVAPVAESAKTSEGDFWSRRIKDEDFEVLQPGHRLRVVVPVWWGKRSFVVAVGGFPERTVSLRPWSRRELVTPTSFRRPVILLRPTLALLLANKMEQRTLEITLVDRGGTVIKTPFLGRSVWIGCGRSAEVPPALRELWQKENGWAKHAEDWLNPDPLEIAGGDLRKNEKIEIAVRAPNGGIEWQSLEPQVVGFDDSRLDFAPQIVDIGKP